LNDVRKKFKWQMLVEKVDKVEEVELWQTQSPKPYHNGTKKSG